MGLRVNLVFFLIFTFSINIQAAAQSVETALRFSVSKFEIKGDNPLGDKAYKVLQPYLGEQSGLEGLSAAADALEQAIIKAGYSFYRVSLPPQQLTSGTIEFSVVRFTMGAINITGNNFFDQQNIENSLPQLSVGSTPNTKELSRSLNMANNHASKNMVLRFREGSEGDTIDANITVQDQNPQIYFLTLDNTGSSDNEEVRSTLGYQHGNLFNRDHALTATLTVAPADPDATTQIGFNYHVPLYAHGGYIDVLFSDSEINSGEVGSGIAITGKGSVFGFNYTRPMLTDSNFNHQWSAGFQSKTFENEIGSGASLFISEVVSFPLELGYGFSYSSKSGALSGGLSFASNIDAGSNNTDADYAAVRPGADNGWSSLKYNLSWDMAFAKNWLFHAGLTGQDSDDLLISGEQFGVGGSSVLRGFEERSVTGDSGYAVSLEIWTPVYANARFLAFIDQASVELNDASDSFDLASAGVGVRWTWKQQLSISLDYGVITEGLGVNEGINAGSTQPINLDDDDKAHFNLVYRF